VSAGHTLRDSRAAVLLYLECLKLLSLGSDKPGKQTVHGLKMHLEKCHKEVFSDYMAKVNAKAVIQELPAKKAKLDVLELHSQSSSSYLCPKYKNYQ